MGAQPELEQRLRSHARDLDHEFPSAETLERHILAGVAHTPRNERRPHTLTQQLALTSVVALLAVVAALISLQHRADQPGPGQPNLGKRSQPMTGPSMVSPTTGWWGDADGQLMRTTDGGMHWKNVTPPGPTGLNDYYIDGTHAWIVATTATVKVGGGMSLQTVPYNLQVVTLRTGDGGQTWQQGAPVAGYYSGWHQLVKYGPVEEVSLYFADYLHGWLLIPNERSKSLYGTTDGGLHWRVVAVAPVDQGSSCQWSTMAFASLSTGWMTTACPGRSVQPLLVTHDGGVTWRVQTLPAPAANTCRPHRVSPGSPLTHCSDPPVFFDHLRGLLLLPNQHGDQVTDTLVVTADGGTSWAVRSLPGEVQLDVEFIDASHGWAIAGSSDQFNMVTDFRGTTSFTGSPLALPLYHTDDGGATWVRVPTSLLLQSSQYGQFVGLHFLDQNIGFADYTSASLLKTTDGGHTWTPIKVSFLGP